MHTESYSIRVANKTNGLVDIKLLSLISIVFSLYDSKTSSQVITESSIILAKYFQFSQAYGAGLQI